MPKRKGQPEPHCIFNDPNTPEDWIKFLVEMCVEKLLKKFENEDDLQNESILKGKKQ